MPLYSEHEDKINVEAFERDFTSGIKRRRRSLIMNHRSTRISSSIDQDYLQELQDIVHGEEVSAMVVYLTKIDFLLKIPNKNIEVAAPKAIIKEIKKGEVVFTAKDFPL